MIRLAVYGVDGPRCEEIARRVRGIEIVSLNSAIADTNEGGDRDNGARRKTDCSPALLNGGEFDFDAVAFVEAAPIDIAELNRLMSAGKHLLLATNSVLSISSLDTVVDRGLSTGVQVVVLNPDHAIPSRRLIHDELRGSTLGAAGLIRIHRWEPASSFGALDGSRLPPALSRDLELVLWLTQQTPDTVFAVERSAAGDQEAGKHIDPEHADCVQTGELRRTTCTVQVHLGFADGSMALIDYSDIPEGTDKYYSLSVICAHGSMTADDHQNQQLLFGNGGMQARTADEGVLHLSSMISQFVDGLTSADAAKAGIARWHQWREVAAMVETSIDSGQAVSLEAVRGGELP